MDSLRKDPWKVSYALFAGIILYLFYARIRLIFSYSTDLDGTEFIFAHVVQLLMQGKPLYPNPVEFPFSAALYTPAYSYVLKLFCSIFNYGPNDLHFILVVARTLSLMMMFINVYFISRLFKQFKLPFFYFLAGITFYLLLITGHFYVTRPDAIKTTLITIFIYTGFQYLFFNGRKIHLAFSIMSALIAVHFKQDAVLNVYLLLVPACLYLRSRMAYLLAGLFTVCLFVSLAGCYAVFGKYFFVNTVLLNFQSLTDVKNSINVLIILFSIARNMPLLLFGIYGCYVSSRNIAGKQAEHFIPFAAMITFLITHAGMLRVGSYLNYSFESILLLILNAALVIRHFELFFIKHGKILAVLLLGYMVSLFASNRIIHSYTYNGEKEAALKKEYFSILSAEDSLSLLAQSGAIFFPNEKYTAFFPEMPMLFGHDFHRGRFIELYHGLHAPSRLSFISSEDYDAWFTDGRVKYIVVDNDQRSRSHVSKYYPHYHYHYTLSGKFCIYRYGDS